MATTPKYGFEAADGPDMADGPTEQLRFLQQIEDLLSTGTLDMTGGILKIAAAAADDHPLRRADILYGPAASVPANLAPGQLYCGY